MDFGQGHESGISQRTIYREHLQETILFSSKTQCFFADFPSNCHCRIRPRDFPFGKDTMHKTPPS